MCSPARQSHRRNHPPQRFTRSLTSPTSFRRNQSPLRPYHTHNRLSTSAQHVYGYHSAVSSASGSFASPSRTWLPAPAHTSGYLFAGSSVSDILCCRRGGADATDHSASLFSFAAAAQLLRCAVESNTDVSMQPTALFSPAAAATLQRCAEAAPT